MPDSMFGRPSQHLLPSYPQASAGGSSVASDTAPVQSAPVSFKDFRFNSIGKQPELLSRISLPQPDHTGYHSSTPSPASTPPPTFTDGRVLRSKSFSRPTLFQQLAGSDFSSSMDEGLRWNATTSQSNRSLASRIQMNDSPSTDAVNTAPSMASRFPSPSSRRRAAADASLIPPVEVLPQPSESSPTTPASLAPALEAMDVHSPTSSTPLMDTTTTRSSRIPTSSVSTTVASREPTEPFPSFAVVDAIMQDLQPSPSAAAFIDSLVGRQERLQAISANLANLASPLLPSSSQSSSPDTSSVSRADDNSTPHQSSQSQNSSTPIVLHHPYLANRSPGRVGLIIDDIPANTNDSPLALVPSSVTIAQEHQARREAVIEAVQILNSAVNAVHRAQINSENALAFQIRTFEEQRAAFEKTKRAQEATLHQEFQELQQKREELSIKEASLASFERESKARDVARKTVLAKRQAQEEEKRAAEANRTQEVQEQITAAMAEIKEIEALRAKGQLEQLAGVTVPDDLPIEPQEGMGEEEIAVIKSRSDLLRAVKHLRRMHSDKVQKLEESNRTLRRLKEEREAEEAERRRIAEEERLRAHAEAERARQVLNEKQHQFEAERKRQEVENDCEQARLSVEQQPHAEVQAHGLRRTEATNDETLKHCDHPGEVGASQQQSLTDVTRIRAAPEANSLSSEVTTAMNVDEDGKAFAPHRIAPLPDIHTNSGGSQSKQKKDKPISGGVMLATSSPKASAGLPPKLLAKPPLLSTSHDVAENALKSARTSPAIILSTEGGHRSSFPAQFASEFNRVVDADIDIRPTPDHKPALPRTPKSQTLLDATIGGSEEFHIGPVTGFSPTQQNVNLRHLKRNRSRIDENDSGDRSVRTNVKSEENTFVSLKKEEHDDQSRELVQASLTTNPPASLPPRPTIIPPPRPWKRHAAPASQTDSISSYPPKTNELSSTKGEAKVTTDEQPRETPTRGSPTSQAMNASVQLPAPTETTNSLLLGLVYPETQSPESRINACERDAQDRVENYDAASSEPVSATLSHELDEEDTSRSNRRFTDEHRRARNGNKIRRLSDHYPPSFVTPQSTAGYNDTRHPQNLSNGLRIDTVRATSPTMGRKRPVESHNNEYGHRARRQRDDVWIAEDHDHDRVASYRSHRDRRLDSELDERRAAYHAPVSPSDRIRPYPLAIPRETNNDRTYLPSFPEEPTALASRWEQSYRRSENDETYQRYQPSAPGYNTVTDLPHADDIRVNQTYEPMVEERVDVQPDPSLLTRMSNTQRFPSSSNLRGRGRGEPNRGRGDFGRGRGRGVSRGTPALLERMTSGPPSLGDRLS